MEQSYKNLTVWQKAMDIVTDVYDLTKTFPQSEIYGLTSQMRRAAVSIPSNIAEGSRRKGKTETRHFLSISFGSGAELETQIEISKRLEYANKEKAEKLEDTLEEVMKMLNKMTNTS